MIKGDVTLPNLGNTIFEDLIVHGLLKIWLFQIGQFIHVAEST